MARYSTDPENVYDVRERFIPFNAQIRYVPARGNGKRQEMVRDLEKKSQLVESQLEDAGFGIATPVAYTFQFGDFTPRLSVEGFINIGAVENDVPVNAITVDHANSQESGVRAHFNLNPEQTPKAEVQQEVAELRNAIAVATSIPLADIYRIVYNGVLFGQGGFSFTTL